MKRSLLLIIYCLHSLLIQAQVSIAPIPAWNQQISNNHYVFTPNNLNSGFSYEVMPLEKASTSNLNDWLKKKMEEYVKSSGYNPPAAKDFALQDVMTYKTCAALVSDAGGKKWMISYMAYKTSSNNIRYVSMMMPAGVQSPYMNVAIKHFINLSKQEGIKTDDSNSYSTQDNYSKEPVNKNKTEPVITGGKTLKADEIKGVVMNMEYTYGVGGMILPEYRPYLLLKDGNIYKYIKVSPYELNVAASKQAEPDKWGTWKQDGKNIIVQFPEKGGMKTKTWEKNWHWARAASNNEKIKGAFKTIGGGGNTAIGGSSMIVVGANIAFNDKGQFTFEKYSGGSSYDFGVGVSTNAKKNTTGTYILSGYSIELRFNSGEVIKKLFYFYPDSKEAFGIGDDAYTPAKN